jgi:hypothetical protein
VTERTPVSAIAFGIRLERDLPILFHIRGGG